MKKLISLLLVAVLAVSCMSITAFAAKAGETVSVTLTATGDIPFNSFAGSVSYDGPFTIDSGSCNGGFFNGKKASYANTVDVTSVTYTLQVTISPDAKPGSYPISGSCKGYTADYNPKDENYVQPVITFSGVVVVECDHVAGTPFEEVHIEGDCVTDRCVDTVTECSKCGEELSRAHNVTTAPGHSYDNGVVTTEPNCTDKGVKTYTCSVCGHTYTEEVAALGHSYDNGVVTTKPTCTEPGVKTYTCSVCGHSYTEEIPATGHTFTDKYERIDDTYHCMICDVCGAHSGSEKHNHNIKGNDGYWYCVCGDQGGKIDSGNTDDEPKNGDITPYPVFVLMAIAAVMGTAYGFKRFAK